MTSGTDTLILSSDINLQEFVKNATWRELLVELVSSNRLDPWDIDIVKVVDGYIAAVRRMHVMDLHIPANIILAASLLLRMKSETISLLQSDDIPEPEDIIQNGRTVPEVPDLVPRLRLQPKRKITLNELMDALGEAIKLNERREYTARQYSEPINVVVEKDDIDEKIRATYRLVKAKADREGMTTFAMLSNSFNSIESILLSLFVPLLFLAHSGRVILMQDRFFSEIFIKINNDGDGSKAEQL